MTSNRRIRPLHRSRGVASLAAVALTLAACADPASVGLPGEPTQPLSAVGGSFFNTSSIWTTPVAAGAPIDPRAVEFASERTGLTPVVTLRGFTVAVFVADATSPRFTIVPSARRTPPGFQVVDVPIPPFVTIDPADNGHLAILDTSTRCVYELYRAERAGAGWTADWVNVTPADGDGVFPDGLSARASGFPSTAGLIWPDELRSGRIPHALLFAYPRTRAGGPVQPATRSDGRTADAAALPMGTRMVLDPAVDIDSLGLSPAERTIADALQRYGMILGDTSNGFTLYAVHPRSFPADPYSSTWGDVTYADISRIPFDRMRVLPGGGQQDPYTGPPIPNRCTSGAAG